MRFGAVLLALASAGGLLTSRMLDAMGVLPGVHESATVRSAVLEPGWTLAGLVGCLVLGLLVDRLLRRWRLLAIGALVLGQLGLLTGLEELARAVQGGPGGGGDHGLWVAVLLQALVATLAVSTTLLVLAFVPTPLEVAAGHVWSQRGAHSSYREGVACLRLGGLGGRAPPVRV